jgi:two-component system, NarL family, sensor histidine kinase UhpB
VRKHLASTPLFWRVFWGNAAVLVVVVVVLVFGPLQMSAPLTLTESISLVAGVALALVISLVLMRPAFRPFDELADYMRRHDPLTPGERVDVEGGPKVTALAQAFNEMLDRLEAEQRESARRALLVQEGERQRVARELHDEVGQTLTGVMLQVEGLAARIPEELRDDLDELRETARSGAEDVRRIVRSLRPEALEDLGLPSALAALATAFHDQADVRVERRLEAGLPLSEEQELVFYRVAQEAITNVARHASASRVEIQLRRDDAGVLLMVRDDGVGLTPPTNGPSHGIRGMRERAMLIGAQLTIDRQPNGGTGVRLVLPPDEATR